MPQSPAERLHELRTKQTSFGVVRVVQNRAFYKTVTTKSPPLGRALGVTEWNSRQL